VWTYEMTDAYGEPVTGQRWWGWITLIADGKVYVGTCEHSAEMPFRVADLNMSWTLKQAMRCGGLTVCTVLLAGVETQ